MSKSNERTITIDNVTYNTSDLSKNAMNLVTNLHVTDQQISRLNQQLAISQTARTAYARALAEELPKTEPSTADK